MDKMDHGREVRCPIHGTFAFVRDICPVCSVDPEVLRAKRELNEQKKADALRRIPLLQAELRKVTIQLGIPHYLGDSGARYENHRLLGSIDVLDKRYARLQPVTRIIGSDGAKSAVVCVPWIDQFAYLLEEIISVHWKKGEEVYEVHDYDGAVVVETS